MFQRVPSNLSEVFWLYTLADIKMSLKLYLGQEQSRAVQYYESLLEVAGHIFGSKKSSGGTQSVSTENRKTASTTKEIMAGMTEIFGGR